MNKISENKRGVVEYTLVPSEIVENVIGVKIYRDAHTNAMLASEKWWRKLKYRNNVNAMSKSAL